MENDKDTIVDDEQDSVTESESSATTSVVVTVPNPKKGQRGQRYSIEEKRAKLQQIHDFRALGQTAVNACEAAGITYASWRKWREELGENDEPTRTPRASRGVDVPRRVTIASGSARSPYTVELDIRDLIAANREAVVAALTVGKHEQVKAAILSLLDT